MHLHTEDLSRSVRSGVKFDETARSGDIAAHPRTNFCAFDWSSTSVRIPINLGPSTARSDAATINLGPTIATIATIVGLPGSSADSTEVHSAVLDLAVLDRG